MLLVLLRLLLSLLHCRTLFHVQYSENIYFSNLFDVADVRCLIQYLFPSFIKTNMVLRVCVCVCFLSEETRINVFFSNKKK